MKSNNAKIQKTAYLTRVALRASLETKVAALDPRLHVNRMRQLIGQLNRLDKKIHDYQLQNDFKD